MKDLIFFLATNLLVLSSVAVIGQPVVKADAVALLVDLPTPPTTLADAYQRAYPQGTTTADVKPYYQNTTDKLNGAQQEAERLALQFYQKYPTGVQPMPERPTNRISEKDKSAMDAATSELAQKMMTDKAFAQRFAKMSEAEQQDYITRLLAEKGLKPMNGAPDPNATAPMPGTDVAWGEMCNTYAQTVLDMTRWEKQTVLQEKYSLRHNAIYAWVEAEVQKLPLRILGEYGRAHDPEQVKSVQKQGLDKHRAEADAMMKEATVMFAEFREETKARCTPLNDALKKVGFGTGYNFGLDYSLVLQTQAMMLGELQSLLTNEMNFIVEVARWEQDWRSFH
ncbi:MAG: hypothetical protein ACKVU2_12770 [Saprospiraceae bacterium]